MIFGLRFHYNVAMQAMLVEKVPRASNCATSGSRVDTPFEIGFVLGLYWVRFYILPNLTYFHRPLLILYLRSFWPFWNWLCLGSVWVRLGSFWVRYSQLTKCPFYHNPLLLLYLHSFDFFGIWVRFA